MRVKGIADYEFLEVVGDANYGTNHLARPPARLGLDVDTVVVKVMSGASTDDTFRRATRELKHFALAKSDTLVRIYDAGRDGDLFYYAMEHLPAGTLADPAEPITPAHAVRAVRDAASAAHALHERGIAHRDIKPANILLAADGGGRLADLGLSQLLSPGVVATGLGHIALEYTDPAIMTGAEASRASDVWSLGACLHFALTGRGVFGDLPKADALLQVRAILASTPTTDPGLEPEVAAFIAACLDADPAARPATAADFVARLDTLAVPR